MELTSNSSQPSKNSIFVESETRRCNRLRCVDLAWQPICQPVSEIARAIEAGGVSPAGVRRIQCRQKGIRRGKRAEPQQIVRGQLICTVQAGGWCRAFGVQKRTSVRNEGHIDDGGKPAAAQGGDGNNLGPTHVRLRTLVLTGGGGLRRQRIQEADLPMDGAPLPAASRIHLPVPYQTRQRAERSSRQRLAGAGISADKGGCGLRG